MVVTFFAGEGKNIKHAKQRVGAPNVYTRGVEGCTQLLLAFSHLTIDHDVVHEGGEVNISLSKIVSRRAGYIYEV